MKKSYTLVFIILASIVMIAGCQTNKIKTQNRIIENKSSNNFDNNNSKNNNSMVVAEIKTMPKWQDQNISGKKIIYRQYTYQSQIPKNIRFILINNNQKITKNETNVIKKWINEEKVVFLYGKNVTMKETEQKFGMKMKYFTINSDVKIYYGMFGYGYSKTNKEKIPWFLGSNDKILFDPMTIAQYLSKKQNY